MPQEVYAKAGNDLDLGLRNIAGQNSVTAEDLFRPLRVAIAGQSRVARTFRDDQIPRQTGNAGAA